MNLLLSPWTWVAAAFAALGIFAAVQTGRLASEKTEFAQFRADVATQAAAARVRNALEVARINANATEVLSDLQTRHAALSARYQRLRANPGSSGVPPLAAAAPILSSCDPKHLQSDAAARFLGALEGEINGILEAGDGEIAKYVQLWGLDVKNSTKGD